MLAYSPVKALWLSTTQKAPLASGMTLNRARIVSALHQISATTYDPSCFGQPLSSREMDSFFNAMSSGFLSSSNPWPRTFFMYADLHGSRVIWDYHGGSILKF